MSLERARELWTAETLTPAEEAELAALLVEDAALRDSLLADEELEGLLDGMGRSEQGEEFLQRFEQGLRKERSATRFVKVVRSRLREGTRRRRRRSEPSSWRLPLLAAAGLLGFAALLSIALWPSESPEKRDIATTRLEPDSPAPVENNTRPELKPEAPSPASPPAPHAAVPTHDRTRAAAPTLQPPVDRTTPTRATPATRPTLPRKTVVEVARLGKEVPGTVFLLTRAGKKPARPGMPILSGQGVETSGRKSRASLAYPDGTVVELGADARVSAIESSEGDRPKRLTLERGAITADVSPQKHPMRFMTVHGTTEVLGTRLRIDARADRTRVEVTEGRVRVEGAEVRAAEFATVTRGRNPVVSQVAGESIRISFGPATSPLPAGFAGDDGAIYDAGRGYGWMRDRRAAARFRREGSDVRLKRSIGGGSSTSSDRWEIDLPDGRYHVTVVCGDEGWYQGPNRVVLEGKTLFGDALTQAGEHLKAENIPVDLRDGRLTMDVGAVGSPVVSKDGTSDTLINYVIITRIR